MFWTKLLHLVGNGKSFLYLLISLPQSFVFFQQVIRHVATKSKSASITLSRCNLWGKVRLKWSIWLSFNWLDQKIKLEGYFRQGVSFLYINQQKASMGNQTNKQGCVKAGSVLFTLFYFTCSRAGWHHYSFYEKKNRSTLLTKVAYI